MGELVAMVVAEPDIIMVATHLVQSQVVGRQFTALLAGHLTDHHLDALRKKSSEVRAQGGGGGGAAALGRGGVSTRLGNFTATHRRRVARTAWAPNLCPPPCPPPNPFL
jgi:hypothetical protein